MNQTQEKLEQLAQLDRTALEFRQASKAENEAALLRSQLLIEGRSAQAGRIGAQTRQRGAEAVVKGKTDLASWRDRFKQWVSDGYRLAGELSEIETPLFLALRGLVGGVRAAKGQAHNVEESALLGTVSERDSLDQLREVGALDVALAPFPPDGNQFARDVVGIMARHVGTHTAVFDPKGGVRQFLSRKTTGAY